MGAAIVAVATAAAVVGGTAALGGSPVAITLGAAVPLVCAGALAACAGALAACAGALAACAGALAIVASRPRLAREGDAMVVRLAPLSTRKVPLDVVECIFSGSRSLAEADGRPPRRRVGTLVIRLAERATDWRHRPTFTPWGTWDDGHIVIDGRWCEPLSPEFARGVAGRLMEAKRALRLAGPATGGLARSSGGGRAQSTVSGLARSTVSGLARSGDPPTGCCADSAAGGDA